MQPTIQPCSTAVPAPAKPFPGTYVLYRDADRYLTGHPDHTRVCRVLPGCHGFEALATVQVLATGEVIQGAPVLYMRRIDPAELMHDIDTAPIDALGDGRLMTAAGAWLATQHRQTGPDTAPAATALPRGRG